MIKVTEGQKISSEDVINYLQNLRSNENQKTYEKGSTSNINEDIFHKTLREARDDFEKLYFKFHMQKKLSVSELAKKSGVERTHLYRKLKSLGIKSR